MRGRPAATGTAAPPMNTLPSIAYVRGRRAAAPPWSAAVGRLQPAARRCAATGTARAVRDLGHARRSAGLPEEGGLLVAATPATAPAADTPASVSPIVPSSRAPRAGSLVGCRRAPGARRSTRRGGCRRAGCGRRYWRRSRAAGAAEPPHEPGVHGAEGELAAARPLLRSGHSAQQPAELVARSTDPEGGRFGRARAAHRAGHRVQDAHADWRSRCNGRRRRAARARPNRPPSGSVLLGHQCSLAAARCAGAQQRARRGELAFGTVDTWLVWRLSGGRLHVTDASNASRTLLYDIRRGVWSDELLELFDIPPEILPEVARLERTIGETDAGVLGGPVPVAGVAGDQQPPSSGRPALRGHGQGHVRHGLLPVASTPASSRWSRQRAADHGGAAARRPPDVPIEGSVFIGAPRAVAAGRPRHHLLRVGGGTPGRRRRGQRRPWCSCPRSSDWGRRTGTRWRAAPSSASRGQRHAHLARATLEGVAFQVAELAQAAAADAGASAAAIRVDGGASASDLLLQFQADVLGAPCAHRPRWSPSHWAPRIWPGSLPRVARRGEIAALGVGRSFTPDPGANRERLFRRWRAAVAGVRASRGGRG